jgi:hypothetical protein
LVKVLAGADGVAVEEVGVRAEHQAEKVVQGNPIVRKAVPIVVVRKISIPIVSPRLPEEFLKSAVSPSTSFAIILTFGKVSGESLSSGSEAAVEAGNADRKGSHRTGSDEDKLRNVLFLIAGGKEV